MTPGGGERPGTHEGTKVRRDAVGGDDCRFVPPSPPHSALALLARDGGECEWRREKREKKVLP